MPRAPQMLVLAIDLGSSSTRAAFVSETGARLVETTATEHYAVRYTAEGGAELDPATLRRAASRCLAAAKRIREGSEELRRLPIAAVAGSAFWHSLLGLDRQGRPATPIYTWADARAQCDAVSLREKFDEPAIQQRTGCMLRASYWPAKLLWLRRTDRALFRRVKSWVSPARWLFRELLGSDSTSHSMASGTGLYASRKLTWDEQLCDFCGVDVGQLGEINDQPESATNYPIFAAIGDGAASNLGSGADRPGFVAINIGTSAAVRMVRATEDGSLPFGLFRYVVDEKREVCGGAISNAGNLREWCLRELNLGSSEAVEQALARTAAAADRLTALPYLVSERAPTWPEMIHGTITNIHATTSAADIFRALTTATYYRLAEVLELLAPATAQATKVIVSGGVLHSPCSLALLADCLGRDLQICRELESSLRGAALHALRQLGHQGKPLRAGKRVRHRPALADKHRERRRAQAALEQLMRARLSPTPFPAPPGFRRGKK